MMYLEYMKSDYKGCRIDIQPYRKNKIPALRKMVMEEMLVENPQTRFADKIENDEYDATPIEKYREDERLAQRLAGLWRGESEENVMLLLSRALQMIMELKDQIEASEAEKPGEEEACEAENPFEDPDGE